MSKLGGWIKLHRQLTENDIWFMDPFSRGQAWVDLLLLACHEDTGGHDRYHRPKVFEEGKVYHSICELSTRWRWSRGRTTKFIKMLELDGMISVESSTTNGTTLTIINWKRFQADDRKRATRRATTDTTLDTTLDTTRGAYTRSIRSSYGEEDKEDGTREVKPSAADIERITEIPAGYKARFGDNIDAFREWMRGQGVK